MPKRINPQDQWETDFQVPLPGEPRNIGPLETLFQRLLNRTERLKNRIAAILGTAWDATPPDTLAGLVGRVSTLEGSQGGTTLAAHRSASVLDHPDGSVTFAKLAPIRNAPSFTPSPGDFVLGGAASGIAVGNLPLGLANGVPFLDTAGSLANEDAYLNRGSLNNAIDWNTITRAGVYRVFPTAFGEGSANFPPASYGHGILLVLVSGPVVTQIYFPHHTDLKPYYRQLNSVWGPWVALGPVYGSNSNGHYVRFEEGTQICWATAIGHGPSPQTVIYPAAFISTPAVLVTLRDIVPGYVTVDWRTSNNVQLTVLKYNPDGTEYAGSYLGFGYIAIGRWR